MHRYIPAIASWIGIKVTEIKVKHHARKYGKSKY
ncbi:MAG TPA: glycosyltransferase, partial [Methanosarcinales archaeon]|nr:glycosyltransferase [Methanosarcinales archaeon]